MGDFSASEPPHKKHRDGCHSRDWARLPKNVLFDIVDRLTVVDDYVRFGGVCVSWRMTLVEEKNSNHKERHCSQPFLLVSSQCHQVAMYSLSRRITYKFDLHLRDEENISRVSSLGWLIVMQNKNDKHFNVHLQNPFLPLDRIIRLPPLDNIIKRHSNFRPGATLVHLCKAALSSDPLLSNTFVVVAIINTCPGLAFFNSGTKDWSGKWNKDWIQHEKKFVDIIFSRRTKQFYALRCNGEILAINLVDLQQGTGVPNLIQLVRPINIPRKFMGLTKYDCGPNMTYLVEDLSSGELLQVHKYNAFHIETFRFAVFKLDRSEKIWSQIYDLSGKVMFLGGNNSVVRYAADCPGCKPNCIYFTEDLVFCYRDKCKYGLPFDGIYSLEDNTLLEHHSIPGSKRNIAPAVWIEPTLVYT